VNTALFLVIFYGNTFRPWRVMMMLNYW